MSKSFIDYHSSGYISSVDLILSDLIAVKSSSDFSILDREDLSAEFLSLQIGVESICLSKFLLSIFRLIFPLFTSV